MSAMRNSIGIEVPQRLFDDVMAEAAALQPDEFRVRELAGIDQNSPGLGTFERGLFAAMCQAKNPEVASQVRAGVLVCHRVLQLATGEACPSELVNRGLARDTAKIAFVDMLDYKRQDDTRWHITTAHAQHPAIMEYVANQPPAPRFGGMLVFGVYGQILSPGSDPFIMPSHAAMPAMKGRSRHQLGKGRPLGK